MRMSALVFAVVLALAPAAQAAPVTETVSIHTASGDHPFEVEVVRSRADMERGLMFRRSLPENRGMLFDFQTAKPIMMWMKNTYLPLDMVFIDAAGRVVSVAERTKPMSEDIIPSGGPALGVLEVNAGVAHQIGLKAGDSVQASIFPR